MMFKEDDVKKLYDKFTNEQILSDSKLKYISNKIKKHGLLYINISELNYLCYLNATNYKYDVTKLKSVFKDKAIGYTSIIKNIGIPKSTLSKLFNNDRNVKLSQLNNLFEKSNKIYSLNLSKELIKEGV